VLLVAFAVSLSTRCTAAGIRPARAGNFLLSRQKKVTKEEALEIEGLDALNAKKRLEATRCALAAVPMPSTTDRTFTPVNAGCTPGSPMKAPHAPTRRPSGACLFEFRLVSTACSRALGGHTADGWRR
jgi:hypothetical protein